MSLEKLANPLQRRRRRRTISSSPTSCLVAAMHTRKHARLDTFHAHCSAHEHHVEPIRRDGMATQTDIWPSVRRRARLRFGATWQAGNGRSRRACPCLASSRPAVHARMPTRLNTRTAFQSKRINQLIKLKRLQRWRRKALLLSKMSAFVRQPHQRVADRHSDPLRLCSRH